MLKPQITFLLHNFFVVFLVFNANAKSGFTFTEIFLSIKERTLFADSISRKDTYTALSKIYLYVFLAFILIFSPTPHPNIVNGLLYFCANFTIWWIFGEKKELLSVIN